MVVTIRKASVGDLDDIYQIELECFGFESFSKHLLESFLKSKNFVNLIAALNGKPVGFITCSIEIFRGKITSHIYSIDVKPAFRRRGIGSKLLEVIEQIFVEKGVKTSYLEARIDNIAAKRLYLKHGYVLLENLGNYYSLGVDGVRFMKDLKEGQ